MKYYEVGWHKVSIEKTAKGYDVQVKDVESGDALEFRFSNEADALAEILSYAEIDKEDFEEEKE